MSITIDSADGNKVLVFVDGEARGVEAAEAVDAAEDEDLDKFVLARLRGVAEAGGGMRDVEDDRGMMLIGSEAGFGMADFAGVGGFKITRSFSSSSTSISTEDVTLVLLVR